MKQLFRAMVLVFAALVVSFQVEAQSKYPEWTRTEEGLPLEVMKAAAPARGTVILAHGCAGPVQSVQGAWSAILRDNGFNTVIFDSWQFRKVSGGVCTTYAVTGDQRVNEVQLVVSWLKKQEWHAEGKIFLMGWSHGGITALAASTKKELGLTKVVAMYPRCDRWYSRPVVPTQVHIGEADDWTPAHYCNGLYDGFFSKSDLGKVFMYPGVYHGYDRWNNNADSTMPGLGDGGIRERRLKTDDAARELTAARVLEFLKN